MSSVPQSSRADEVQGVSIRKVFALCTFFSFNYPCKNYIRQAHYQEANSCCDFSF